MVLSGIAVVEGNLPKILLGDGVVKVFGGRASEDLVLREGIWSVDEGVLVRQLGVEDLGMETGVLAALV